MIWNIYSRDNWAARTFFCGIEIHRVVFDLEVVSIKKESFQAWRPSPIWKGKSKCRYHILIGQYIWRFPSQRLLRFCMYVYLGLVRDIYRVREEKQCSVNSIVGRAREKVKLWDLGRDKKIFVSPWGLIFFYLTVLHRYSGISLCPLGRYWDQTTLHFVFFIFSMCLFALVVCFRCGGGLKIPTGSKLLWLQIILKDHPY